MTKSLINTISDKEKALNVLIHTLKQTYLVKLIYKIADWLELKLKNMGDKCA